MLLEQLILNQDIIPNSLVYRADDPNFGVAKSVVYDHAFGLNAAAIEKYVESLDLNHYWKTLTLGKIEYAQARNAANEVIYEVVYSRVIGDGVNTQGESVSKELQLPYPVTNDRGQTVDVVYPNSLINMRDQVIDVVGQISPLLPAWMTSNQGNGRVLGFTPAWVIAYVKPGEGARIVYNIQQQFGDQLNLVDFKADRYEIDRRMTYAWEPYDDSVESDVGSHRRLQLLRLMSLQLTYWALISTAAVLHLFLQQILQPQQMCLINICCSPKQIF